MGASLERKCPQVCGWLSGLVTFAEVATILNTIGEIPLSPSSIWRRAAAWGPKCQAVETAQRAASVAAPTREELNQTVPWESQDLGVAMDGGMVHLREEGWKELRTGPPPLRGGHTALRERSECTCGQSRLRLRDPAERYISYNGTDGNQGNA